MHFLRPTIIFLMSYLLNGHFFQKRSEIILITTNNSKISRFLQTFPMQNSSDAHINYNGSFEEGKRTWVEFELKLWSHSLLNLCAHF